MGREGGDLVLARADQVAGLMSRQCGKAVVLIIDGLGLLRNACTYTEQGRITVLLDPTEVSVTDTGPGIPAEELDCLFEHADRGRRTVRGAGISLPLVKRIADRQGWDVSVDSRPRQGATFRLRFHPQADSSGG